MQKRDLRLSITDPISDGRGNARDMDMDIPVALLEWKYGRDTYKSINNYLFVK